MKRKLLILIGVVAALVIVLLGATLLYLGPLVKKGVETVGPMVTQVDVKLASARVSLLGGGGALHGLVVGNPAGYKSPTAMKLDEVSVAVAPGSVFSDKIHIKSVAIITPEITVEGGLKENNLTRILANVQAFSGPGATNQTEAAVSQKKLQLDSLVVRGAKVNAQLNVPGLPALNLTLPDIELSNLGQGPEGITAAELVNQLISRITSQTLAAVADSATKMGKAVVEGAAGTASDAAKAVTGAASDAASKAASGAADKALKGVGDLFKKKN
jgi:uncharacterized protein involved in outer membrane biogenesis